MASTSNRELPHSRRPCRPLEETIDSRRTLPAFAIGLKDGVTSLEFDCTSIATCSALMAWALVLVLVLKL